MWMRACRGVGLVLLMGSAWPVHASEGVGNVSVLAGGGVSLQSSDDRVQPGLWGAVDVRISPRGSFGLAHDRTPNTELTFLALDYTLIHGPVRAFVSVGTGYGRAQVLSGCRPLNRRIDCGWRGLATHWTPAMALRWAAGLRAYRGDWFVQPMLDWRTVFRTSQNESALHLGMTVSLGYRWRWKR